MPLFTSQERNALYFLALFQTELSGPRTFLEDLRFLDDRGDFPQ